eukprot:TRINITY_DN27623_c0_g1_i1.p1 TRINITY_DN27623_c0_g1~~TRINITY_DN27623_c0_g1_i1.p1  ORF type:complete len:236 (+),score=31.91 TRINITY_DN27623_c0_g1_i1:42-710(+)
MASSWAFVLLAFLPVIHKSFANRVKPLALDAVAHDADRVCPSIHFRGVYPACEKNPNALDPITLEEIESDLGVCIEGKCYSRNTLSVWLEQARRLPHAPNIFFTKGMLSRLFGDSSDDDGEECFTVADLLNYESSGVAVPLLHLEDVQAFLQKRSKEEVMRLNSVGFSSMTVDRLELDYVCVRLNSQRQFQWLSVVFFDPSDGKGLFKRGIRTRDNPILDSQ